VPRLFTKLDNYDLIILFYRTIARTAWRSRLGPQLNYHHLYYFKVIASEGSIAKAGKVLRLGQSTLSTQLKQFEDALGKSLFDRRKRSLILTELGGVVLEYANEIFRLGSEMTEAVNDRLGEDRVHLQIGALDSIPKHMIIELVKAAYNARRCTVSILEGKSDELLRELHVNRIDLLLTNVYPPMQDRGRVMAREVARMPVIVCGTQKFANLKPSFPHSLNGQPMVMPLFHGQLRHDVMHYFEAQDIRVDIIAETQDTSVQKLLGLEGVGLIPIAEVAVRDLIKTKLITEIGAMPGVHENIWLVAMRRKVLNPVADILLKEFQLPGKLALFSTAAAH
jgi:LysR family transcriptional regulator, transcriptional activator of nhaA